MSDYTNNHLIEKLKIIQLFPRLDPDLTIFSKNQIQESVKVCLEKIAAGIFQKNQISNRRPSSWINVCLTLLDTLAKYQSIDIDDYNSRIELARLLENYLTISQHESHADEFTFDIETDAKKIYHSLCERHFGIETRAQWYINKPQTPIKTTTQDDIVLYCS